MPRDPIISKEKREAIIEAHKRLMRLYGQTHCIKFIYQLTAQSPAPSFFITYEEGRSIINASEKGVAKLRKRDVCTKRDSDFVEAYKAFMVKHRGYTRKCAILETIASTAPEFYIDGTMVAYVVALKQKKI